MDTKTQNTVAVVVGLAATTAIGAALIPLMKIVLTNTVVHAVEKRMPVNNAAIYGYEFLWATVSAFVGGYIACWIAVERKLYHAFVAGVFSFLILVFSATTAARNSLGSVLMALAFIPLTLMGGIVRRMIENKKADENY